MYTSASVNLPKLGSEYGAKYGANSRACFREYWASVASEPAGIPVASRPLTPFEFTQIVFT